MVRYINYHISCLYQNPEIKILTMLASSDKYCGCINYDKACPYNATSAPRFTVSAIGHGGNLLE